MLDPVQLLVNIIYTLIISLTIPFFVVASKKKFRKRTIKIITAITCFVHIMIQALVDFTLAEPGETFFRWPPVILWTYVAYKWMMSKSLMPEMEDTMTEEKKELQDAPDETVKADNYEYMPNDPGVKTCITSTTPLIREDLEIDQEVKTSTDDSLVKITITFTSKDIVSALKACFVPLLSLIASIMSLAYAPTAFKIMELYDSLEYCDADNKLHAYIILAGIMSVINFIYFIYLLRKKIR